VEPELIRERVDALSMVVDELVSERASQRIGEEVSVLIEAAELQEGRAAHQGPEVDGTTSFIGTNLKVGQYVQARVVDAFGADLIAQVL
jgi:ribosomal protein S12 methylthiotransferase